VRSRVPERSASSPVRRKRCWRRRPARAPGSKAQRIQHSLTFGADPIPGRRGRGAEEYPVRERKSAGPLRLVLLTGCHQASDLSKTLGCKRNDKGGVVIDPETEKAVLRGYILRVTFRVMSSLSRWLSGRARRRPWRSTRRSYAVTGFAIEARQLMASFSALGNQRQTPIALIRRRMTFWMTRDVLVSSQPSAIQAIDAKMNIMRLVRSHLQPRGLRPEPLSLLRRF